MSKGTFNVGSIVRFVRVTATESARALEYRIEQLVRLEEGATLYKIRSEAEPFDRVVAEGDLATHSQ